MLLVSTKEERQAAEEKVGLGRVKNGRECSEFTKYLFEYHDLSYSLWKFRRDKLCDQHDIEIRGGKKRIRGMSRIMRAKD